MSPDVHLYALTGIPDVQAGDDLTQIILDALQRQGLTLRDGDVLVVTQKIVSKAEGRAVPLATVVPSQRAMHLARLTGKDPRLVEVILRDTQRIVRQRWGLLITKTKQGWICANAGVDRSNVSGPKGDVALPLPANPDASARLLYEELRLATGVEVAVIISDTYGRPWRRGTVNLAIGVAGMHPLLDLRGQPDMFGYILRSTVVARADELAAAAGLVMGQAAERIPAVLIRGVLYTPGEGRAVELQRSPARDLFR